MKMFVGAALSARIQTIEDRNMTDNTSPEDVGAAFNARI